MRLTTLLDDFSLGLDLVSSLNTMAPGSTPSAKNFRIAEYGGIEKVLGYSEIATLPDAGHDMTYFEKRDGSFRRFVFARSTAWTAVDSGGAMTHFRTGMTAADDTTFIAHEEILYGLDANNDMASWDGTTLTVHAPGVSSGPPRGKILGVWSNRMYVAPAATPMRVVWSDPGNFTGVDSWPAENYVELGGPGVSDKIEAGIPTPDGLAVFATRSVFLIYDTNGASALVDGERGTSSRRSLALVGGSVYGLCHEGVFRTNGRFPLEIVSRRVDPLFTGETPDLTDGAGTWWRGSYLASFQRPSSEHNNLMLDVTPVSESGHTIMAHDYPALAFAAGQVNGTDMRLWFIDASDPTKIRRAFHGGSAVGAPITCHYDMPPHPLGDEAHIKRMHRARVVGRGNVYVGLTVDYRPNQQDSEALGFPTISGGAWDLALWDAAAYGGYELFEGWARIQGKGRRLALRFYETSTEVYPARTVLGSDPPASPLGGAGVYSVEPHFTMSSRRR